MGGWESRFKDCLQQSISCKKIRTKYLAGRKGGWMDGRESRVKDCLQQSKSFKHKINSYYPEKERRIEIEHKGAVVNEWLKSLIHGMEDLRFKSWAMTFS